LQIINLVLAVVAMAYASTLADDVDIDEEPTGSPSAHMDNLDQVNPMLLLERMFNHTRIDIAMGRRCLG